MAGIIPIPTTRVGDLFVRQRLTQQSQFDQLDLFKLQNQISTGRRLEVPSDDAPAALRAISLQRLLDRKGQISSNLRASNQYLSAADSNLSSTSDILIKLRGDTVGIAGTLSSETDRRTLIQQIDQALETLVATGNAKSQGRYLFAGSRSQAQPFNYNGDFVEYSGNEGVLRSYVDLERLFDTNLAGTDVFGGISNQMQGGALAPHLSADTLVSTINNGNGIGRNGAISIAVMTGTSTETSVVDLSGAVTLGDVARMIEEGAPAGTDLVVDVTGSGLRINAGSGSITINEVAAGHAARELGILTVPGDPVTSIINGDPLNPAVLNTTRLTNLLGTKAQGRIVSAGNNNDIVITANENGTALNDVRVVFVSGGTAGSEVATYDDSNPLNKTLTVQVQAGVSTATQVATAIRAEGTFTAAVDYHDATSPEQSGSNPVTVANFGQLTSGGSGAPLDTDSGFILTNGGRSVTIDLSSAETVEDLLNLVNGSGLGLQAEINADRDGINIRSRLSGADFTIGENGGTTATQLGLRTYTGATTLADFNHGVGVSTADTLPQLDQSKLDSITIVTRDGVTMNISLAGATTMQGIANRINSDVNNHIGTTSLLAQVTANGNGIELIDSSTAISNPTTVQAPPGTTAATYLGLVADGQTQATSSTTNGTGDYVLSGKDVVKNDLSITTSTGTQFWVDLTGASTVQDVIDRIGAAANDKGVLLTARLAQTGNGIELVDGEHGAGVPTVAGVEGSQAAEDLGFLPNGAVVTDGSGNKVLTSGDRHTLETDSVFNTLMRLKTALENNDTEEISRSIDRMDTDLSRVNFARAEIGARLQNLDVIDARLDDENVQLKSALSEDVDVDLVAAISSLTARQYAFEASLRTTASLLQLSLLNFI